MDSTAAHSRRYSSQCRSVAGSCSGWMDWSISATTRTERTFSGAVIGITGMCVVPCSFAWTSTIRATSGRYTSIVTSSPSARRGKEKGVVERQQQQHRSDDQVCQMLWTCSAFNLSVCVCVCFVLTFCSLVNKREIESKLRQQKNR